MHSYLLTLTKGTPGLLLLLLVVVTLLPGFWSFSWLASLLLFSSAPDSECPVMGHGEALWAIEFSWTVLFNLLSFLLLSTSSCSSLTLSVSPETGRILFSSATWALSSKLRVLLLMLMLSRETLPESPTRITPASHCQFEKELLKMRSGRTGNRPKMILFIFLISSSVQKGKVKSLIERRKNCNARSFSFF